MDSSWELEEACSPSSSELTDELQVHNDADSSIKGGNEAMATDNEGEAVLCAETEASPPLPAWRRNYNYYFSLVTFRVGCQLFRVPREGFEMHSEVFRSMFATKTVSQGLQEGDTDDNPIHLEGIDEDAFEDFLQLLYPRFPARFDSMSLQPPVRLSCYRLSDRWTKILNLAHIWCFKDIRNHAISKLEIFKLDEVCKAEIAHKYEIYSWYMPVYIALATRMQPLTVEEAQRLGLVFTVKMGQVRERRLSRKLKFADAEYTQLKKDIEEIFGLDDSITS